MEKVVVRFAHLLMDMGLSPASAHGKWLLSRFAYLLPRYSKGQCTPGHYMDRHVLFMLVLACDWATALGPLKFGCDIAHLVEAIMDHNLDRNFEFKDEIRHPDKTMYLANFEALCQRELVGSPFSPVEQKLIAEACAHHGDMYDPNKGSQLQRRLQELDMTSRIGCQNVGETFFHRGCDMEDFDFNSPWLCQMQSGDQRRKDGPHSIYTIQLGVVLNWYTLLPPEIQTLVGTYIGPYVAYQKGMGLYISKLTGEDNQSATDLQIALGDSY